jgi:hypothetical protein
MENLDTAAILAILIGLLLRFGLPMVITLMVIVILRKVDARWQKEAEQSPPTVEVENPHCWEIKNCTPEQMSECPAPTSTKPCWQIRRQKNGYLREECLTCQVFQQAPLPAPIHP